MIPKTPKTLNEAELKLVLGGVDFGASLRPVRGDNLDDDADIVGRPRPRDDA